MGVISSEESNTEAVRASWQVGGVRESRGFIPCWKSNTEASQASCSSGAASDNPYKCNEKLDFQKIDHLMLLII